MKKLTFLAIAFVLAACCMTGCRRGSGAITDPQETTSTTTEATTHPTEATVTMPTNEPAVTLPTDWTAGTDDTSTPQDETGESLGRGKMPGIN